MSESSDHFLELQGMRLKVRLIGHPEDGPVLVFLHEALGCIEMWKGFPEELCRATGLPGLVFDRQGHGGSSPLPGPIGPRSLDYLHIESHHRLPAVLEALDIERLIPVGHSDGGTIALLFAAARPQAVDCLITEAAHVFVEPVTRQGIRQVVQTYETTELKERLAKYHGPKTEALFRAWCDTWLSEEFATWNIEAELAGVTSPILVMQGADDEFGTRRQVDSIAAMTTGPASPLLLSNCGHIPHLQARDRALESMASFVERQLKA